MCSRKNQYNITAPEVHRKRLAKHAPVILFTGSVN
jgi:hypothetical protein